MGSGGRSVGHRGGALALAMLVVAAPIRAQPVQRDDRDERQERERAIRQSQQSPRALIDNLVIQRERRLYDPVGITFGGFRLYPSVGARITYDSNVFNIPDAEGDAVVRIEPAVALRSDWSRHSVSLDATSAIERFARLTSNDVETYDATLRGIVDVGRGGHVAASARSARQIEQRGSIGDLFPGGEPVRYRLHEGTFGGSLFVPGLRAAIDTRTSDYRYFDVRYQGTIYPQNFRDRREYFGRGEIALLIGPQLALFTQLDLNDANYHAPPGAADFSSHGLAAIGGVTFQIFGMLSGEAGIGYLRQTYDALPLPTIDGLSYDLDLVWNVTPLLTISARGQRNVQQTAFVASPSVVTSTATARFDYELRRNVLVNLNLSATIYKYARAMRPDHLYNGIVSVRALLSRSLTAELALETRRQDARSPFARTYRGSSVRIGLTAQR